VTKLSATFRKGDHPRGRRLLIVFAGLTGILIALLISELGAGLVVPAYDTKQHVRFVAPDRPGDAPPLGVPGSVSRQVKNTGDYDVSVRINQHGFRDKKDISTATPEDYVMVGDSFIFGWGVDENLRVSDQLEPRIGQRVFNIGVTGDFNTYRSLLEYGTNLGARIRKVVVAVTMESDIIRYDRAQPAVKVGNGSNGNARTSAWQRFMNTKAWLMANSTLYFMTTSAIHQHSGLRAFAVRAGLIVPNLEGVHQDKFDPVAIEQSADRLAHLFRDFELTVFLIPSRALWHGESIEASRRTHAAFLAALRARQIDTVDLKPAFEKDGAPLSYHFRNDGHWNPAGHELAARLIGTHLMKRRLSTQ
jgi:hypothetical protein